MKIIEFDEQCQRCEGTGLYVGTAERDGAAIVCSTCKGTGCHHFKHSYEEFTERVDRDDVKRVYAINPGFYIGTGNGYSLESFGGITFEDWKNGTEFTPGTEDRNSTCPAWWYQSVDYKKKPEWRRCSGTIGDPFSGCPRFGSKAGCWYRWDEEFEGC